MIAVFEKAKDSSFLTNLMFAILQGSRWGRCYESYSEDPEIVKQMTDIILGLQGDIPAGSRGREFLMLVESN